MTAERFWHLEINIMSEVPLRITKPPSTIMLASCAYFGCFTHVHFDGNWETKCTSLQMFQTLSICAKPQARTELRHFFTGAKTTMRVDAFVMSHYWMNWDVSVSTWTTTYENQTCQTSWHSPLYYLSNSYCFISTDPRSDPLGAPSPPDGAGSTPGPASLPQTIWKVFSI